MKLIETGLPCAHRQHDYVANVAVDYDSSHSVALISALVTARDADVSATSRGRGSKKSTKRTPSGVLPEFVPAFLPPASFTSQRVLAERALARGMFRALAACAVIGAYSASGQADQRSEEALRFADRFAGLRSSVEPTLLKYADFSTCFEVTTVDPTHLLARAEESLREASARCKAMLSTCRSECSDADWDSVRVAIRPHLGVVPLVVRTAAERRLEAGPAMRGLAGSGDSPKVSAAIEVLEAWERSPAWHGPAYEVDALMRVCLRYSMAVATLLRQPDLRSSKVTVSFDARDHPAWPSITVSATRATADSNSTS